MAFAEDLSLFFDADEHAVTALLDGVAVVGIFEQPYLEVAGMASTAPAFRCPAAALTAVQPGSVLVHDTQTFEVRSVEPDGTGLSRLTLELVA